MTKKIFRSVFIVALVFTSLCAVMSATDYLRCRVLKEPVFVRPIIADDSGEGVFEGICYNIQIFRDSEQDNNITEMRYSLFGSGVMTAEFIDGQIYVKNLDWLSAFFN